MKATNPTIKFSEHDLGNVDAEKAVLCALLSNNENFHKVDGLTPEKFFSKANQIIATIIWRQIGKRLLCDTLTVISDLRAAKQLEQVGGGAYLQAIAFDHPAVNVERYCAMVLEKYKTRALAAATHEMVELVQDQTKPIQERIEAAQNKVLSLNEDARVEPWVDANAGLSLVASQLTAKMEGAYKPLATGIDSLDRLLGGGTNGGELVVIGARSGVGKTAFALSVAANQATAHPIGFISLEMSAGSIYNRLVAIVGRTPLKELKEGAPTYDTDKTTFGCSKIQNFQLYVSDKSGMNVGQITTWARNLKRRHGLKNLFIDYLGLISSPSSNQNKTYQVEAITNALKVLAKDLDITVTLLCHLNRKMDEKGWRSLPQLADLKDSGAIEQDADTIIFLHRPIHLKSDLGEDWQNYARAVVAKQRDGETGVVNLTYTGEYTRFDEWCGPEPFHDESGSVPTVTSLPKKRGVS
jgi:replicative DNA helicase